MSRKFVCIHGHFYQPPRENPWLERVEVQDSAYPYHDWNERITEECYAPNAASRLLDHQGKVREIVNNYAKISFNFGPTLLAWMEQNSPETYREIIKADAKSAQHFGGHGSAIAQVYNHIIMPLANRRDKETQIIWGIRDFVFRFGRLPEGMWLAETAVDTETLELLVKHGIKFTILSPYQALSWRENSHAPWHDARGGNIDPTRPYWVKLPHNQKIAVFFYDGPISRSIAFEGLLRDGSLLANKLLGAFVDSRTHHQIVHIATDGETYGHHHRFGEMALSYAIDKIERETDVELINYAAFLERYAPECEAQIIENSSWSCIHGIERWRSNCGCNSGGHPGWTQEWRAPLREAFDWLRDIIAPLYELKMKEYTDDPWYARNEYIDVILNRTRDNIDRFLSKICKRNLKFEEKIHVLKLLEMQRHALLMYTSCAWFFDELSGIETVQCIQYAARVVQLAEECLDLSLDLEEEFIMRLGVARSNIPEIADGRKVYETMVRPAMLDLTKVAAHYAVTAVLDTESQPTTNLYSYRVVQDDLYTMRAGNTRLAIGHIRVTCETTLETDSFAFGAVYFGDHNVSAGVGKFESQENYQKLIAEATFAFQHVDFPGIIRILDRYFANSTYSLRNLFSDEQRKAINRLLKVPMQELDYTYQKMYKDYYNIMRFLVDIGTPLPRKFKSATNYVMDMRLKEQLESETYNAEAFSRIMKDAKRWCFNFDTRDFSHLFQAKAEKLLNKFLERPHSMDTLGDLEAFIRLIKTLPFSVNLWKIQNEIFRFSRTIYLRFLRNFSPEDNRAQIWFNTFQSLAELLQITLPEDSEDNG